MTEPDDDRAPAAVAYQWASRVMTVSLEMAAPGLVGYWIDQRLGSRVVFTVLGTSVGMALGIWHLIRMSVRETGQGREER